jgi:hypothetical protein
MRQLTEEQVAMLRLSAAHYAEKAVRYAASLKVLPGSSPV